MADEAFWAEVKRLNWPAISARVDATYERAYTDPDAPHFDFDREHRKLLKRTPDAAYWARFQMEVGEKRDALSDRIVEWERRQGVSGFDRWMGLGDDSFRDLTNHIIGMGRDTYEAVMADPSKAADFSDSYVESFSYLIPDTITPVWESEPNPRGRKKKSRPTPDARAILRRAMRGT